MRIKTNFDYPPIPIRDYDWSAWDDETYDEGCLVGHGKTEQEAIDDLIEQIKDNNNSYPITLTMKPNLP